MGVYAMTGGATGIGAATKEQLLAGGHRVIVVDIKDAEIVADLSTAEGRLHAIESIRAAAPEGLDGLIPCAGVGPSVSPASLITRINYYGTVDLVVGLKDLVAKKQGRIVVISSNSAPMGADSEYIDLLLQGGEDEACARADEIGESQNAYGGSKLALARWMRREAVIYAGEGIRMNAVAPGITQTPLTDKVMEDPTYGQLMKDFGATVPIGSMGQPEQIADTISFLLSPAADFIVGSVIFVDGGHDAMLRPNDF